MGKTPVRIGHVVGKMIGGGVESMLMNCYRHVDKSKFQFDFIIDDDSSVIPQEEIDYLGGKVYKIPPYEKMINYNTELYHLLKQNQYKIVHSHINSLSVFPLRVAKKADVKVRIAHSHSTSAPGETKKNIAKNILRPFSTMYPTDYMACSATAAKWLFGNKINNWQLINNGIDTETFKYNRANREAVRRELNLENRFIMGHTGRLSFQKNQEFLINLMPYILEHRPNAVLMLLGEGEARKQLEELVSDLNIQHAVLFLGNQRDVYRYYSAMDIFVFPSRYEGFGISSIEAQVSGLPVIQSNHVPSETRISVNCKTMNTLDGYKNWADEILAIKKEDRESFNQLYEEYEIKNTVKELEKFYSNKLEGMSL